VILQSLVDLAAREGLVEDPSYQQADVSFAIVLDGDGGFVQLMDLRQTNDRKKQVPKKLSIPKRAKGTSNDKEEFLVHKSEYVLGAEPDGKRAHERLTNRLSLFRSAIVRAYDRTSQLELNAVLGFLDSADERNRCIQQAEAFKYKSNDLFCFEVDDEYVHDLPAVKEYWSVVSGPPAGGDLQQCVLCGRPGVPVRLHAQFKLAGGGTTSVALISFNQKAFLSYGWSGNQNAPVCQKCADSYSTALRRSLDTSYPNPANPDVPLPRQSVVLSKNLTAVYWTDSPSAELLENVGSINDYSDDDARYLTAQLQSPWKGSLSGSAEGRFYCLFLQGAEGRATLRDWQTQDVRNVQDNLRCWFEEINVLGERPRPLRSLLDSLAVKPKEGYKLPERFIRALFLAAVFGRELPLAVLAAAVERNKSKKTVSAERAGLLQAYFIRNTKRRTYMALDESATATTAYRLGRLLAVLQAQQARVNPKLNKNITDRFFTSMSTRPASVFPSLMALGRTHTRSLKEKDHGYFDGKIAEILDGVKPVPNTFRLADQGEFALGYYHQRYSDMNRVKAKSSEAEGSESSNEGGNDDAE